MSRKIKMKEETETMPLSRYGLTLNSLRSMIDGAMNADSHNERQWHLGLAMKVIQEELYLYQPRGGAVLDVNDSTESYSKH